MTQQEFNTKYKQYIPEGWGGLEFDIPEVTDYLDSIMDYGLVNLPDFKLHQIKLKFGMNRFYFETSMENKKLEAIIEFGIEQQVNNILMKILKNGKLK
jgi:hypothetical protein